jgi:hypothetical protein
MPTRTLAEAEARLADLNRRSDAMRPHRTQDYRAWLGLLAERWEALNKVLRLEGYEIPD